VRRHPWVSRGGVKLDFALTHFGVSSCGLICLDLGASTGGFTDVLLGARRCKGIRCGRGRGQLHPKISADPRVVSLEATDFPRPHPSTYSRSAVVDYWPISASSASLKRWDRLWRSRRRARA